MFTLIPEEKYTVPFGGTYEEHWTQDYRLTVTYVGRRDISARKTAEGFAADSPLPVSPLAGNI